MSIRCRAGQHQAVPLWAVLGAIMTGITNTQAGAQISHTLKAFDCERPTEVMAQAIPEGCSVLAGESPEKIDPVLPEAIRQEYAIVQEVTSYVLSATLCEIRRSRLYFDCVWSSHARVAAPPEIYRPIDVPVSDCANMFRTGKYTHLSTGQKYDLSGADTTYIQSVPFGDITHSGEVSHCMGAAYRHKHNGKAGYAVLIVEDLAVTMRNITLRKRYDDGEVLITESGIAIPLQFQGSSGAITDQGTLVFHNRESPCAWKEVRRIHAVAGKTTEDGTTALIDIDQKVHVTLHHKMPAGINCPEGLHWHTTGHARIRVVLMGELGRNRQDEVDQFARLPPSEILYSSAVNLKLEYAFYMLQTKFTLLSNDDRAACDSIKALTRVDEPDNALQANMLTFAKGEVLYSLRCPVVTVHLAVDWAGDNCFRNIPVRVPEPTHQDRIRFLAPGSRLLMNVSEPEECAQATLAPRGYATIEGTWVALTPHLQLLRAPPELTMTKLQIGDIAPEAEAQGGAYRTTDLLRWAELNSYRIQRRIAKQHVSGFSQGLFAGRQFRKGYTPEQFSSYLDHIAEQAVPDIWESIKLWLYRDFVAVGSFCSILVCCAVICASCYSGFRFLKTARDQALATPCGSFLKAVFCGVSAILLDAKYAGLVPQTARGEGRNEEVGTAGKKSGLARKAPTAPNQYETLPAPRARMPRFGAAHYALEMDDGAGSSSGRS